VRISTDHYARALLKELDIKSLPTIPREIIKRLGISLHETEASDRFDGWILRVGGSAAIGLNASISSEERKNFTLAHELGHYKIPHHSQDFHCLRTDIESQNAANMMEREANEFAAELLMPEAIVQPLIEENEIGFKTVKSLAEKCATSLMSTTYRYLKYTPYLAALVTARAGKIITAVMSPELYQRQRKYAFDKEKKLNKNSVIFDYFDQSGEVACSEIKRMSVLPSVWFPSLDSSMVECFEETIGFPRFKTVLSLVWIEEKDIDSDDFGDDDE
jgi:Zn-dependent peptidase ImmA (M78 family)